jgi:hypothetical protein
VSSTLLTRIGEPVTNGVGSTAINDAALIIEDEAVAWTGPPAWPTASQPPRTGGSMYGPSRNVATLRDRWGPPLVSCKAVRGNRRR